MFIETKLSGNMIIENRLYRDERGWFEEVWGGDLRGFCGSNISFNLKKGTLRGLHYQFPDGQGKLVRCIKGRIWDVAVDLRPDSETYLKWSGVELSGQTMFYVPPQFAHGYLTLEDDTEVLYQVSHPYIPEQSQGIRWNDPTIGIDWPITPTVINERDRTYPDFE